MNSYNVITLFPNLIEEWKNTGIINKPIEKIITLVRAMRGGASGGTIASIINIIIEGNRRSAKLFVKK